MSLFEYKSVDKYFYEREIKDFLPERIIDAHTHVYSRLNRDPAYKESLANRSQNWPTLVASENPIEDLKQLRPLTSLEVLDLSGVPITYLELGKYLLWLNYCSNTGTPSFLFQTNQNRSRRRCTY